ncbi:uncharacterized protein EURHEDRAFT_206400 [Aspergillus ruber CBS 135680]|uniref:Uncharacterized protein n=1 Tax=Aspergillus ruber (strain CBS 135680) TaxID=1388766 RepID=A0A017SNX4_ASPRC|nr:uncharacterized protein EURHEDRAFT_206400 [Aspergillus ruber CBS 135680]EYE98329.1 hypothetical protein EURHEDRAFT_206400 [Aspergillus ruber CBS 135680]
MGSASVFHGIPRTHLNQSRVLYGLVGQPIWFDMNRSVVGTQSITDPSAIPSNPSLPGDLSAAQIRIKIDHASFMQNMLPMRNARSQEFMGKHGVWVSLGSASSEIRRRSDLLLCFVLDWKAIAVLVHRSNHKICQCAIVWVTTCFFRSGSTCLLFCSPDT